MAPICGCLAVSRLNRDSRSRPPSRHRTPHPLDAKWGGAVVPAIMCTCALWARGQRGEYVAEFLCRPDGATPAEASKRNTALSVKFYLLCRASRAASGASFGLHGGPEWSVRLAHSAPKPPEPLACTLGSVRPNCNGFLYSHATGFSHFHSRSGSLHLPGAHVCSRSVVC